MSFNWIKFIKLAEKLHNMKDEESFRSAISRSYYGVFCIIRNLKGFKNYKKSDVHYKVIKALKSSYDKKEKSSGWILDGLRKERNYADYNEDEAIDQRYSERCIKKARKILMNMEIK